MFAIITKNRKKKHWVERSVLPLLIFCCFFATPINKIQTASEVIEKILNTNKKLKQKKRTYKIKEIDKISEKKNLSIVF